MAACPEYEERLDLHAAGALEGEEAVRVIHHLEACAQCRAAFKASVEVLSLAALPPPSAAERAAAEELPQRALAAWRRGEQHRGLRRRTLGSLVAAAAAVVGLMLLIPGVAWRSSEGTVTVTPAEPVAAPAETEEVDAETMAAIEAWAGLEPLDTGLEEGEDGAAEEGLGTDEEPDFNLGETL